MNRHEDASLFSVLQRKSIIDPRAILKTCHKNCMYKTADKSFQEVSTQCQESSHSCADEQTQVSRSNESKDTQTSPTVAQPTVAPSRKYAFVNPYALIDRVNQGEDFLHFLCKQNSQLGSIFTHFLKSLQNYADQFLLSLRREHSLYGTYRRDMIWYITQLQESMNDIRTKVTVLQQANKNFGLFQKHFHKISQSKCPLEDILSKHDRYRQDALDRSQSGTVRFDE